MPEPDGTFDTEVGETIIWRPESETNRILKSDADNGSTDSLKATRQAKLVEVVGEETGE